MEIDIEATSTGYELTIDEWFIDAYKTIGDLQQAVEDRIRHDLGE